jgi:hypothetical protein
MSSTWNLLKRRINLRKYLYKERVIMYWRLRINKKFYDNFRCIIFIFYIHFRTLRIDYSHWKDHIWQGKQTTSIRHFKSLKILLNFREIYLKWENLKRDFCWVKSLVYWILKINLKTSNGNQSMRAGNMLRLSILLLKIKSNSLVKIIIWHWNKD